MLRSGILSLATSAITALAAASICSQSAYAQKTTTPPKDIPASIQFDNFIVGKAVSEFDTQWVLSRPITSYGSPAAGINQLAYPATFGEIGGGVRVGQANGTGNFFGPGTGNGLTLPNNNWEAVSLVASGGLYRMLSPNWYGGVEVNLYSPSLNSLTVSGITSNGIPVNSTVGQSGPAVDLMGRIGTNSLLPGSKFLTGVGVFLEGGVNVATYKGEITAPSVGDYFSGSTTIVSPVVGGGFKLNFCQPSTYCPFLEIEATHVFVNKSWPLEMTPLSSGDALQRGSTHVAAKLIFSNVYPGR